MHINNLDDIVTKYKNTCYSTIKMKPVDLTSSTCIDFDKEDNKEDPKFKVGHHVVNHKIIFAKLYVRKFLVIAKVIKTLSRTYTISDLKSEEIVGTFYKKEKNEKELRVEKITE